MADLLQGFEAFHRARIVEAHAVDQSLIFRQTEHARSGISFLFFRGNRSEFDEAEAKGGESVKGIAGMFDEAGCKTDWIWEMNSANRFAELVIVRGGYSTDISAGYRMPSEIGEQGESEFMSRFRVFRKTEGERAQEMAIEHVGPLGLVEGEGATRLYLSLRIEAISVIISLCILFSVALSG